MNDEPLRQNVLIRNPHGFHVRPAYVLAQAAGRFDCEAFLIRGDQRVNARQIMELLSFAADKGTELVLEVCGPDAAQALPVLVEIIEAVEPPQPQPQEG
jgi:phosphotransferase system HPr (HPr) family protein